jgi:hypothetical protein
MIEYLHSMHAPGVSYYGIRRSADAGIRRRRLGSHAWAFVRRSRHSAPAQRSHLLKRLAAMNLKEVMDWRHGLCRGRLYTIGESSKKMQGSIELDLSLRRLEGAPARSCAPFRGLETFNAGSRATGQSCSRSTMQTFSSTTRAARVWRAACDSR